MKKVLFGAIVLVLVGALVYMQKTKTQPEKKDDQNMTQKEAPAFPKIVPIEHASMVLDFGGQIVYTDPVGEAKIYVGQPLPDIILLTDIHQDHLSTTTLEVLFTGKARIFAPKAVYDKLPKEMQKQTVVLANGQTDEFLGMKVEAVAMYNVPEKKDGFHTKGRGNGYVLEKNNKRVYVSGDTGNTPEMRALLNIDIAFLCMNLPYTMSVEEAASAVLAFKPKKVIPYHYRGPEGLSDTAKFKQLVNETDPNIEVELLNFYQQK